MLRKIQKKMTGCGKMLTSIYLYKYTYIYTYIYIYV